MNKKNVIIATVVIVLILLGIFLNNNKVVESTSNDSKLVIGENGSYQIIVDVKGEVRDPGLYYLNSNSRVIDAINIAGGLTMDADIEKINLATKIEDGMIVNIFKKELDKEKSKISINKGTMDELTKLPGIGEAKAKSIIDYRNKNGYFMSLEEIKKVDGITENIYKQIKEQISI